MACCLLAMMLLAQAMATLRRWGAFWGLVQVPEGVVYHTFADHARSWLAKPVVRAGVMMAVMAELGAVGGWLYVDHRDHVAQIVADGWARATGHRVIYAGVCDGNGDPRAVRLVLDGEHSGLGLLN